MLRKLLFGCSHRFSWPMKLPDGTYYQVCVHCGAEYGYDWERMRRTTAIPSRIMDIRFSDSSLPSA